MEVQVQDLHYLPSPLERARKSIEAVVSGTQLELSKYINIMNIIKLFF